MADVSLSTQPGASPTKLAALGTMPVDGTAEGTTPFASLLTNFADPAASAGKKPAPLPVGALPPTMSLVTPKVLTDPRTTGADPAADQADLEGATSPATLAPDLSAFLAPIVPPSPGAVAGVRAATPPGGTVFDGAKTTAMPNTLATIPNVMTQASPPDDAIELAPIGQPAVVTPDRIAPAFAAIRATATIPQPANIIAPIAAAPAKTAATARAPAIASPAAAAGTTPVLSSAPHPDAAPAPRSSSPPVAGQPIAPVPVAPPADITGAVAIQAADPIQTDDTTPGASLPTDLAYLAPAAGKPLAARAVPLPATRAMLAVLADPSRSGSRDDAGAAQTDDAATPSPDEKDPTPAALAPDLGAFIAPPAQQMGVAVAEAAAPQAMLSSAGARTGATPDAIAMSVTARPAPTSDALATSVTVTAPPTPIASPSTQDAAAPAPRASTASIEPAPTDDPVAAPPDRVARAFAAIRTMAARAPAAPPAATSAAAVVRTPSDAATNMRAARLASAVPGVATSPAPASAAPARDAPTPQSSSPPADGQPTAADPAPPGATPAVTVAATQADPIQDAAPPQDTRTAPRPPAGLATPAAAAPISSADPAVAAASVRSAASVDTLRPAVRARKMQDTAQIGDVRASIAPTRTDVAAFSQATPAPLADDPVARQLSIAQDGQWLDSLAKDIANAGDANGQLRFRLDPDHLGSLTVQLTQTADGASVRLTASTEAARAILADAQPRLVAEARAQGLTLREATVETHSAAPPPTASAYASFSGSGSQSGRSDQGGVATQLQQQAQQQGGNRQRAPDQPRQAANPAPRAPASTRSGADLYA